MKTTILFTAVLAAILLAGCGNRSANRNGSQGEGAQDNAEVEHLKLTNLKLTENEWQEILASYAKLEQAEENISETDGDADPFARVLKSEDIALGGKFEYYVLKQLGFQFLTDADYTARIKYVYGIDLNDKNIQNRQFKRYDDYSVFLTPRSVDEDDNTAVVLEFYGGRCNNYFFRKLGTCSFDIPSVLVMDKENSTDKDNVYLSGDGAGIYHWNNYVLHGNQESLEWLISTGCELYLNALFFYFGYDKEQVINKMILDNEDLDFRKLFASRDVYGKLQIREGLLETVAKNSTKEFNDYYQTLEAYTYALLGEKPDDREDIKAIRNDFNLSERRKIAAYAVNTLQPVYEKFNPQCSGGEYGVEDKYDIGVTDSFWNILFSDRELIGKIEKNDCYGLTDLKKLIAKMRADERFINKSTGALEPWIFTANGTE